MTTYAAEPMNHALPGFAGWRTQAPLTSAVWNGNTVAVAVGDGSVRLLRPGHGTPLAVEANPSDGAVLGLCVFGEDFLAAADDGTVMRISPQGEASVFTKVAGFAEHVAYEALSRIVVVASGKKLYLFGTDGQPKTVQPFALPSSIGGLAVSPTAARLAASHYNGVQVYALDNLKQTEKNGARLLPWKGSHLSLTYSPDGKWLISSMQENAIHLWRLADGLDLQMRGYLGKPTGFSWSHDGNLLATTGGAGVPLWSFKDKTQGPAGQQARVIAGSNTPDVIVTATAMHPNGPFVAVGYTDGLVLLANVHDNRSVLIQAPDETRLEDAVSVLEWSADGMNLLSGTASGIMLMTDFTKLLNR